jgi:hypothetical protein
MILPEMLTSPTKFNTICMAKTMVFFYPALIGYMGLIGHKFREPYSARLTAPIKCPTERGQGGGGDDKLGLLKKLYRFKKKKKSLLNLPALQSLCIAHNEPHHPSLPNLSSFESTNEMRQT